MSSSGGMSQLLKGIVIGIVLILAIVGTMSLLDSNKSKDLNPGVTQSPSNTVPSIPAPTISINPQTPANANDADQVNPDDQVASNLDDTNNASTENKPFLEGEQDSEQPAEIEYGVLTVSSVNPENKESLNASFVILDKENTKVAETINANTASYRLPIGEYKITATLSQLPSESGRPLPVVEKTQQLTISTDSKVEQVFELEPPSTIGILQVSAVSSKAGNNAVRSNFVVQKDNGETVATRNNVTNSLFKLNAGSYKVTVRSGSFSDFRTVIVEAGESTQETFKLQEAAAQGRVLIRVFDTRSSNPVNADISISDAQGNVVQTLSSVTKTEISLAQGNYKISVTGPNGKSNKNIKVIAGKSLNEIFRFDAPQTQTTTANSPDNNNGIQITDNVTIKAVETTTDLDETKETTPEQIPAAPETEQNVTLNSNITILARNASDNRPIKSNIYIQTPNGKNIANKTYVDSASFQLPPGVYKVTVRSKNRVNSVKTLRVSANQQINETFMMSSALASTPNQPPVLAPPKPAKSNNPASIPSGFLNVIMQGRNNQNLNSHFIVSTNAGKKIVELTSVSSGNFKLDTGVYKVTAIHKNQRRQQRVTIRENQNTRLIFNSDDFGAQKGLLRSRIIDEAGRPLKGNLTVTDMRGRVVARANNVSVGEFKLDPKRHTVSVNYRGLSGSEVINVNTRETTVQTFTIATNTPAPVNRNTKKNDTEELKRILKEKLKEQLQKQF